MILRELFYFDKETLEPVENDRYDSDYDQSIMQASDTRKTRMTLRQINRARKSSELHTTEQANELEFVRQMYGLAGQAAAAGV